MIDVVGRRPWFRVYDAKLNDPAFMGLTNAEWGIFHKLECLANLQNERGVIEFQPEFFCQSLARCLNVRKDRVEKYLTKFKKRSLLNYDIEEGWVDLIYLKRKQKPMSDAERKRLQRDREKSRQHHKSLTPDVTHKNKEINKEVSKNEAATPPSLESLLEFNKEIDLVRNSQIKSYLLAAFEKQVEQLSGVDRKRLTRVLESHAKQQSSD